MSLRRALRWVRCHILGDHDWTCKASQAIDPTAEELADGLAGFLRYAQMYCTRCGYLYRLPVSKCGNVANGYLRAR